MAKAQIVAPPGLTLQEGAGIQAPPGLTLQAALPATSDPNQPRRELTSDDIDPEVAAEFARTSAIAAGEVRDDALRKSASEFLRFGTPTSPQSIRVKQMDTFDLLEVVNQAKLFKDKRKRNIAFSELRRRGIPNDFIDTFTQIDDATG